MVFIIWANQFEAKIDAEERYGKMQKILIMHTEKSYPRASVCGWSWENGDMVDFAFKSQSPHKTEYYNPNQMPVGLIRSWDNDTPRPNYPTILHALGDGWKLLAPPIHYKEQRDDGKKEVNMYEWWLVKD